MRILPLLTGLFLALATAGAAPLPSGFLSNEVARLERRSLEGFKTEEGRSRYRHEALEMFKRLYPGDHADVARVFQNIAVMLTDDGRTAKMLSDGLPADRISIENGWSLMKTLFRSNVPQLPLRHCMAARPMLFISTVLFRMMFE